VACITKATPVQKIPKNSAAHQTRGTLGRRGVSNIKAKVSEYFTTLNNDQKAAIYVAYSTTAPQSYLDSMVEQQLAGISREDIEKSVLESYPEYAEMISSMDDDMLFSYMSDMIKEQVAEQYTAQAKAKLSKLKTKELAKAFDSCYFTDEGYRMVYENYMLSSYSDSTLRDNLKKLGYVDLDVPTTVNIYVSTFADKDAVTKIIQEYNDSVDEADQISYTDYVGLIMSSVTTIINVISYILIAFVAISLVVSSIMIGIITYISVLERTKEIGILRAIGASKKDISSVFNAETIIVGFCAGLIGILSTILLCVPINAIVHALTKIETINAHLPALAAVILVLISMGLTVVAGLIPSGVAAKKDPVEALRTE